jgi:hypothetical protein
MKFSVTGQEKKKWVFKIGDCWMGVTTYTGFTVHKNKPKEYYTRHNPGPRWLNELGRWI